MIVIVCQTQNEGILVARSDDNPASYTISEDGCTITCTGNWTLLQISKFEREIESLQHRAVHAREIDCHEITHLDSAGAYALYQVSEILSHTGAIVCLSGLSEDFQSTYDLVAKELSKLEQMHEESQDVSWLYRVGKNSVEKFHHGLAYFNFAGELSAAVVRAIKAPQRFQWKSLIAAIDDTGYQALPIVALMLFLIGIVVAYQLGEQLRIYGASIFVVDASGIAILREFAPLITAIVVAGRTSTSFAALIGTMKVNEEIDALKTMGLSPYERLVIPRILGLVIALPLLVVWADLFGILGSMVMTKYMLGINFHAFLERFEFEVGVKHYILGLIKVPVFAMIVATVGCFQGFRVGTSAQSVGEKTTHAAVQAIFLIIIADATFSIIYSELGF